jgi:NAD-dependent dihydropyrimidine dehydrogenase PreA subunit
MGKQKEVIVIDYSKCAPCTGQICIGVCPQGALEEGKNRKPMPIDVIPCTSCGVCVNLCPSKAITIKPKESKSK